MRHTLYWINFSLFFACNSHKEDESDLLTLEIAMNTELIDSGQEILFLNWGLDISTLSKDKKYLYNVNPDEYSIEQINLNTLTFEKKYTFEKEGRMA